MEHRITAEQCNDNNHSNQRHRQYDQIVANFQHGFLEMADGVRLLHQLRRLAEVGVLTRGIDQGSDFAAAHDRTGKYRLGGLAA